MIRNAFPAILRERHLKSSSLGPVLTIWRKVSELRVQSRYSSDPVTDPVTLPVSPPVAVVVLIQLIGSNGALGNSEILTNLGLSDRTHLREHYIDPAIASGLVERTIPEKPTSRLQKYRLTEKGQAMLEQLKSE
jgi:predicted transcriptional regulator